MKRKNKVLILVFLLGSAVLVKINFAPIFNFLTINLFPRIERRGNLDEAWDYAIIDNSDKSGRNKWEIGIVDNKINIYETASAPVVRVNVFKNIDMDYVSMEDYYNREGPKTFRKFIEKNNK